MTRPSAASDASDLGRESTAVALVQVEDELKEVRDQLAVLWEREKVLAKARRGLRGYMASQRPQAGERRG